jgi:hypothetical protein
MSEFGIAKHIHHREHRGHGERKEGKKVRR